MRLYHIITAAYFALVGCTVPIKGDASLFSGDKSRTLEARVKVGDEGPGIFVRERLTNPNYADQSVFTNFAITDGLYSFGDSLKGVSILAGTRSTARFDADNTRNNNAAGHIDPRVGVIYTRKVGDFRLFANPTVFADFSTHTHHPQFEGNVTVGYQHEIKDGISLELEAENVGLMDRERWKQGTHRLRGGLSYKGVRVGIGTDVIKVKGAETSFNNGVYVGIRF